MIPEKPEKVPQSISLNVACVSGAIVPVQHKWLIDT